MKNKKSWLGIALASLLFFNAEIAPQIELSENVKKSTEAAALVVALFTKNPLRKEEE